jgi:hypothetical protein
MRVGQRIYHIDCFRCCMCAKQLAQGDEFALKDDGLLCKLDNEIFENHMLKTAPQPTQQQQTSILGNNSSCQNITNLQNINPNSNQQQQLPLKYDLQQHPIKSEFSEENHQHNQQQHIMNHQFNQQIPIAGQQQQANSLSLSMSMNQNSNSNSSSSSTSSDGLMQHHSGNHGGLGSATGGGSSSNTGGGAGGSGGVVVSQHRKDKTTRVRTVLNEKQLHTLRTCYGANPRPDALMKEQLVEMTGLSPRVIRVWFQNKRCKDKKKTILLKQMQEQQKV